MHAVDRKDAMPQSYRTGAVRGAAHARVTPRIAGDVGAVRRPVMNFVVMNSFGGTRCDELA
jgi:hypothetical protein